jgi:hypothetical protein
MGALSGEAVGEVSREDEHRFTFVAQGSFDIDGNKQECGVEGEWDGKYRSSGEVKIQNELGEFSARFDDGVKGEQRGRAVIEAVLNPTSATGVFKQISDRCSCEIIYESMERGKLEFSLF